MSIDDPQTDPSETQETKYSHEGASFLAELKRRLLFEGFTVAVPEPDLGDDLWIVDLAACNQESPPKASPLVRCQVKFAKPTRIEGHSVTYTINFTQTSEARMDVEFYYFLGLFQLAPPTFHIACVPSAFFRALKQSGNIRFNSNGRPIFDFFLHEGGTFPKYTLRLKHPAREGMKYGRGPRADVGQFFLMPDQPMRSAIEASRAWNGTIKFAPKTGLKPGPKGG